MSRIRFSFLVLVFASAAFPLFAQSSIGTPLTSSNIMRFDGFMFDIEAHEHLSISSFDVHMQTTINPIEIADFEIWVTTDEVGFSGLDENAQSWTLLKTIEGVVSQGTGIWTQLNAGLDLFLPAGSRRGLYVTRTKRLGAKIEGQLDSATNNLIIGNPDLSVRTGWGLNYFQRGQISRPDIVVHYQTLPAQAVDLRVHNILGPTFDPEKCDLGNPNEMVVAELMNIGSTAISPGTIIPISYQRDNDTPVVEFLSVATPFASGSRLTYSFTTPLDLSMPGTHTIVVSAQAPGDGNTSNDSISTSFISGGELKIDTFPFVETFDGLSPANVLLPPFGWTQDSTDSFGEATDWQFDNFRVRGTRPNFDHTSGVTGVGMFAHTDDEGHSGSVNLRTPCFDFTSATTPRLVYWVHSEGFNVVPNTLSVDVFDSATSSIISMITPAVGNLGPGWHKQVVDLSSLTGKEVRLIFRADTSHAGGSPVHSDHDIAIDDVAIVDEPLPLGQPAQPGFAVFKIEGARNSLFDSIDSLQSGPFYAVAQANRSLVFEFEGEPDMPLMLLGGPINQRAATYPVIGSLDIGGPLDPFGIPVGITVLANGDLTDGVNPFFNTGPMGQSTFGVSLGNLQPGPLATFQCVMRTSGANGSYIALSNAIDVVIQ